ncbi:MAG: hypothetical protein O2968_05665 [Acidobacteria bacterium]|nr:hypothetical protein [Acidobacteriota bacterium]
MKNSRFGEILCVWTFLICVATPAAGGVEIRESRLFVDGAALTVRGVVYSPTPIGRDGTSGFDNAACLYTRDLPLIAAMGANTIRTTGLVRPDDRPFRVMLDRTGLYWLAGFPLQPFHDVSRSLSPDTADGQALRVEILAQFQAFVEGWKGARILAFVFGEDAGRDYETKFAGDVADYYSLLAEAAAWARAEGVLLTATVSELEQVGPVEIGTDDAAQPDLAFWSLNRLGAEPLGSDFEAPRLRTSKPLLISSFGVDAYDAVAGQSNRATQAAVSREAAVAIEARAEHGVLGGVYAGFVDEWWRGGDSGTQQTAGRALARSPDGFLNEAWLGLFRTSSSIVDGLDRIRPRDVYFVLANEWGGTPPPEMFDSVVPKATPGGVRNMAGRLPLLSPGSLFLLEGANLASVGRSVGAGDLPLSLGPVSVCMADEAAPLIFSVENEIRGQLPWSAEPGIEKAVVYRAGIPSDPVEFEVQATAPGIFEDGVFRPGRPCPVNVENGIRPGSYLEIYGSGLGPAEEILADGQTPATALAFLQQPTVRLGGRELPVLFSAMMAGFAGVSQTNVAVGDDFPAGLVALVVEQAGAASSPHMLRVTSGAERPSFRVTLDGPETVLLQAGGPARTVFVLLNGLNSFCDLVRFDLSGLPAGVTASLPVGAPGQTLRLTLQAEAGAPPIVGRPVVITGRSTIPETVDRVVRVTVLPSLGAVPVQVVSGGWLSTVPVASFGVQGSEIYRTTGGGPGRGFNFVTVDPETGVFGPVRAFDTWLRDADVVAMEDYLKSLPLGVVVLGAIADDGVARITAETRRVIRESLGSELIDHLEFRYSWAIISRKGAAQPIDEGLSPNGLVVLAATLNFPMP